MSDVNYSKRLIEWRKSLALTQIGLAAAIGVSRGYIGDIEAGRSEPSRGFLQKLTEKYGVRADWILYGTGAQTAESEASTLAQILTTNNSDAVSARWAAIYGPNATVAQIREAEGFGDATVADMFARFEREAAQIAYRGIDFTIVPLHEAWLSAGAGRANGGANIIQHLAFRSDWLMRTAADASRCCLARVAGDSMLPTLCPGDMVLIDPAAPPPAVRKRTPKDTRPAPIWAILDNNEARVKRIERPADDALVILSDNPAVMPEWRIGPQAATVQLIGKVLWWGHTATM
jgi:phage repressor protein C with HTH and peptisase S24 domain